MRNNTDFIYLLRFIAALWVVIKHYSPVRNVLVDNGGEAVSFFFLLSGFILVVAYEKLIKENRLSPVDFYVKRIARVYPLYVFALSLTLAFHFFVQSGFSNLPRKLPFELLMVQSWFYSGSINYVAWSISCELFFYILFPLYIVKWQKVSLRKSISVATLVLLVGVTVSYVIHASNIPFLRADLKEGYLYEHPIFRIPIFFLGNLLGFLYIRNIKVPATVIIILFLLGCAFLGLFQLHPVFMGLSLKQAGLAALYLCLLIVLLQNTAFSQRYLSHPFFIFLGDISYGVYLLQGAVFSFVLHYTEGVNPLLQFALGLVTLFVLSALTYKILEKPLRSKIVNKYKAWAKMPQAA